MTDIAEREPRIVIVGAGPSGCFIAGALRRSLPGAQILVIDRLPCPFGLVRYGVAADHQSTKSITRQFDRIFTREGVEFAGNVRVVREPEAGAVTLDELVDVADAVVLATGLAADRPLGVPGDDLPGVYGSGAITGLLNSHPDGEAAEDALARLGERVSIVGMGNVAIDLIRFLAKEDTDFDGSDINDAALDAYRRSQVASVDVFSRSPIELAKCDAQMIRELSQIAGLHVTLHGAVGVDTDTVADRTQKSRVEALRELAARAVPDDVRIELRLHFGARPERVVGTDRVERLLVSTGEGSRLEVAADSIISAIGFEAGPGCLAIATPDAGSGRIRPGLYRVGWLRRGPRGTIPENRADAVAVAAEIVSDFGSGAIDRVEAGTPILPEEVAVAAVSYDQWLAVDRHERESAPFGRIRAKLRSSAQMLHVARENAPAA